MRPTSMVAAAVAATALLLPGGSLPVARASGAEAAVEHWTARDAAAFWTPERMAAAIPLPDPPPPASVPVPAADPQAGPLPEAAPDAGPDAVPAADPAAATDPAAGALPEAAPSPATDAAAAPAAEPAPDPAAGPRSSPTPAAAPTPGTGPGTGPAAVPPLTTPPTDAAPLAPLPASPAPHAGPTVPGVPAPPTAPPAPGTAPTPPGIPSPAPRPVRPPALPASAGTGRDFGGVPAVGRMFVMKGSGAYFCTASVVSSAGRDLVISAAHCLLGSNTRQIAFVPRYTRAKPQPYGLFPVLRDAAGRSRVWIHQRYRTQGAEKAATLDVAFARVGPNSAGKAVEKVVGGNRLVTGATFAHPQVTLIGYPSSAARPRICVNRTTKFTSKDVKSPGSFLRINCTGYPGGTSGGPFLVRYDAKRGTGDVVGVIGGWKTGGPTPDTSYSSYFGAEVRKLYQAAVAGARVG
ncbi:hypothetical protein [Streptomyces sp. NPDC048606]|uniref:hypothetical protein n=1 Tax=Streptomyces sp. NPDC048606 TaxID=3154726 RepID=UPI0034475089